MLDRVATCNQAEPCRLQGAGRVRVGSGAQAEACEVQEGAGSRQGLVLDGRSPQTPELLPPP